MTSWKHILVIDDGPANLMLLRAILEFNGYRVTGSPNGTDGIQQAKALLPDLILLDISMPDMDGFTVCEQLKDTQETASIPVIFISSHEDTDDKVRAFQSGGVDYITKPFQADEVLARIKTHIDLQSLKGELETQVSELEAFSATVAHDIKSPLGTAIGFAEQLLHYSDDFDEAEKKMMLEKVIRNSHKAVSIVDELLLLAHVNRFDMPLTMVDMERVMPHVIQRVETYQATYGGDIGYPQSWPIVRGHGPWLEEVWVNLISNGLKYGGDPPQIIISWDKIDDAFIRFSVIDNGHGLTPEEQKRLFVEFSRIHRVNKNRSGHGLGLSIVKRIVEKLNGKVGVHSEIGHGSCFYFILPISSTSLTSD